MKNSVQTALCLVDVLYKRILFLVQAYHFLLLMRFSAGIKENRSSRRILSLKWYKVLLAGVDFSVNNLNLYKTISFPNCFIFSGIEDTSVIEHA